MSTLGDHAISSQPVGLDQAAVALSQEATAPAKGGSVLSRESEVIGGGIAAGLRNGIEDIVDHPIQTALEFGVPAAAYALTAAGPAWLKVAGKLAGSIGGLTFGFQAASGISRSMPAIQDALNPKANLKRDQAIVASQLGPVAFNLASMGLLSGAAVLTGRFAPSLFKTALPAAETTNRVAGFAIEPTAALQDSGRLDYAPQRALTNPLAAAPQTEQAIRLANIMNRKVAPDRSLKGMLEPDVTKSPGKRGETYLVSNGVVVERQIYGKDLSTLTTHLKDGSSLVERSVGPPSIKIAGGGPKGSGGEEYILLSKGYLPFSMKDGATQAHALLDEKLRLAMVDLPDGMPESVGKTMQLWDPEEASMRLEEIKRSVRVLGSFDHDGFPASSLQPLERFVPQALKGTGNKSGLLTLGDIEPAFDEITTADYDRFVADFKEMSAGNRLEDGTPYVTRAGLQKALWDLKREAVAVAASDGRMSEHAKTLAEILHHSDLDQVPWDRFVAQANDTLNANAWDQRSSQYLLVPSGPEFRGDTNLTMRMKLADRTDGRVVGQGYFQRKDNESVRRTQIAMHNYTQLRRGGPFDPV